MEIKSIEKHYKILIATYLSAKEKKLDEYSARKMVISLLLHFEKDLQKTIAIKQIDKLINNIEINRLTTECVPTEQCKICFKKDMGCFQKINYRE